MASSGKKKTTMAKLDRERRMREKRMDKQARKDARKQAAIDGVSTGEGDPLDLREPVLQGAGGGDGDA